MVAFLGCSGGETQAGSADHPDTTATHEGVVDSAPPRTTLEVPPSRAGHLLLADGALTFIPCDAVDQRVRLVDTPDGEGATVVTGFHGGVEGVPVLLRLDGERLVDIRYAAPEGPGCSGLPSRVVVDARGNEPFWSLQVFGDSARMRVPLALGGYSFTHGAWRHLSSGDWAFEASRTENGREEFLVLHLTEVRCTDSMSGARYPFRAELVREGDPAMGCAVEGRLARRLAPATRRISVRLNVGVVCVVANVTAARDFGACLAAAPPSATQPVAVSHR
jgi:uncharacterized membrane protein